jgi:hypothetical protein
VSLRRSGKDSGYGEHMTNTLTTTTLTYDDIDRALADERHHGWGYACRSSLNERARHTADAVVLRAANEQGWDYDQLFEWCDSKSGRHFSDLAYGSEDGRWTQKTLYERAMEGHYLDEVLPGT